MPIILSAGQCHPDQASITRTLKATFGSSVSILSASSHEETLAQAKERAVDLILINRLYDSTGTEGLKTIVDLKADPGTAFIPVMMVSNFAHAQEAAVDLGALPGFGKAALNEKATSQKLQHAVTAENRHPDNG